MVVDVALWLILAAMIALIACGCIFTSRAATQPSPRHRDAFEGKSYHHT